jgi:phage tail sheath protein FI
MATPQLSPGVLVREVDLTVGRADNVLDNIGAIAGPFAIGPVDEAIDITTENELISVFGKPISTDAQYEYWMSASSYLSYGGVLKVVRVDGNNLVNANAIRNSSGVSTAGEASLKIKNFDDYEANFADDIANYIFASKNPGSWANNLKICVIDDKADQIIGINTISLSGIGASVGAGVTVGLTNVTVAEAGITTTFNGYLKGIITGVNTTSDGTNPSTIDVKIVSRVSNAYTRQDLVTNRTLSVAGSGTTTTLYISGSDLTQTINTGNKFSIVGVATYAAITGVGSTSITIAAGLGVSVVSGTAIQFTNPVSVASTETPITYANKNQTKSIFVGSGIAFVAPGGSIGTSTAQYSVSTVKDWYDNQLLNLDNSSIYWSSIAPKPGTSQYAVNRNGRSDEIHVVIVDDTGSVTGIQGNLLEKHLGLSKATDAISAINSPQKIWWKNYLAVYSNYVYVGDNPSDNVKPNEPVSQTGFSGLGSFASISNSEGLWNTNVQDKIYSALGNVTYTLTGGKDYSNSGGMVATLGDLFTAYNLFSNKDEIEVDYLIMGPGLGNINESQAKANHLVSIANARKDCMAVISPHRGSVVDITNSDTQTDNIIDFFNGVSISSSYAVFDSGYKYTYDRFNNKFRYIPCNPDVAGLMVRTSIVAYPWFSPAGQQRGILNNAIKLAYNPNKAQRDQLYPLRINSIVNQPGIGILLFGDKTALGYASAFDRINVRRLFLTVEQALQRSAQAQLFELNDEITRANFRNIVEPYLRDVQAKRGLYGFLVVCDASNNTPDVIDNNEFRADIYLKPAKSINYVTLTFVATRTGVSFDEVAGTV